MGTYTTKASGRINMTKNSNGKNSNGNIAVLNKAKVNGKNSNGNIAVLNKAKVKVNIVNVFKNSNGKYVGDNDHFEYNNVSNGNGRKT